MNWNKIKRIGKDGLLLAIVSLLCIMAGCSDCEKNTRAGSCTVCIIENDGYKFAVAVGYNKCAITQIKEEPR